MSSAINYYNPFSNKAMYAYENTDLLILAFSDGTYNLYTRCSCAPQNLIFEGKTGEELNRFLESLADFIEKEVNK